MVCSGGAIVYLIDCSFGLSFASKYYREDSTLRHSVDSACHGKHNIGGTSWALTVPGAFLQSMRGTLCRFRIPSETGFRDSSGRFDSCNFGIELWIWNNCFLAAGSRRSLCGIRERNTIVVKKPSLWVTGWISLLYLRLIDIVKDFSCSTFSALPFMGAGREWIKHSPSFLNSVLCCDIVLHGFVPSSPLLGPIAGAIVFLESVTTGLRFKD